MDSLVRCAVAFFMSGVGLTTALVAALMAVLYGDMVFFAVAVFETIIGIVAILMALSYSGEVAGMLSTNLAEDTESE